MNPAHPYVVDGTVEAYTGEVGLQTAAVNAVTCYQNTSGTQFVINGHYTGPCGGRTYLSYDGHPAYDFAAHSSTVLAAADGVVVIAQPLKYQDNTGKGCKCLGNYIVISHANGAYQTWYGHLKNNSFSTSILNTVVSAGSAIAVTDNTGDSTGEHLHFEVRQKIGNKYFPVDPYGWRGQGTDPYTILSQGTIINTVLWGSQQTTMQVVWPVPGHDSQRTGLANYVGPGQIPNGRAPRWSYSTSTAIVGDIVVSAEGMLYVTSDKLYALTPSGTSYAPPVTFDRGVPLSGPAIDDTNGFVYVVVSSPNSANDPNLRAYDVVRLSKLLTNQTTVYHSPYPYSNPNIVPHGLVIGTDGTVYFTDGATVVARGGHSWTTGTPNTGPCFGNPGFLTPTLGSDGSAFVPCQAYAGNAFGAGLYKFEVATGAQLKYTPYPYMRVEFMFDTEHRLRAGDSNSFGSNSTGHYDAWDTNLALTSDTPNDDTSSRSSLLPDGSSTVRIGKSTLVDPTNTFYYDPKYQGAQTNTLSARGAHNWDIRGGTGGSTAFFSTVPSVDSAGNIFVGTVAGIESRSGIDGSLIWSFATGDVVSTQPVIAGPGVLYVGTNTGKIYAF